MFLCKEFEEEVWDQLQVSNLQYKYCIAIR